MVLVSKSGIVGNELREATSASVLVSMSGIAGNELVSIVEDVLGVVTIAPSVLAGIAEDVI